MFFVCFGFHDNWAIYCHIGDKTNHIKYIEFGFMDTREAIKSVYSKSY